MNTLDLAREMIQVQNKYSVHDGVVSLVKDLDTIKEFEGTKIALHGTMGSGKDYASDFICEVIGGVVRESFAKPIYDIIDSHFQSYMPYGTKNRELLQHVGDGMRAYDPYIWVTHLVRRVAKTIRNYSKHEGYGLLITDVRYLNELYVLNALGFTIIEIKADNDEKRNNALQERDGHNDTTLQSHISEQLIIPNYIKESDNYHLVINDYTIDFKANLFLAISRYYNK